MKTKTIGQCKDCKWWSKYNDVDLRFRGFGKCNYDQYSCPVLVHNSYGCWYWGKK